MATNDEIRAKDILPHKTSFSVGDGFYGDGDSSFFMEVGDMKRLIASTTSFDVMWDLGENDYVFPNAQDVIQAVGEYIDVQLVFHSPAGTNFVYALTYKSASRYEWTREDCQGKFDLVGEGSPVTWTWTEGDTRLKQDVATLDTDIGKIGGSIAPAYSSTDTYAKGDLVMYARRLYECATDIIEAEEWNSTHWIRTNISSIIGNVEALLADL